MSGEPEIAADLARARRIFDRHARRDFDRAREIAFRGVPASVAAQAVDRRDAQSLRARRQRESWIAHEIETAAGVSTLERSASTPEKERAP
jgi:hypothetical protein